MYQLGKTKNFKFFEKSIIPRGIISRYLPHSKIPSLQNSARAKKLGGKLTVRKSPIGSTNNQ
ncbi:hypothetical protein CN575_23900 [Bacillus wiedmannii]|uniref:Spermidine/putrescine ABC transporter ATP-binding protein n=1 Tax=Bacillus thuringiensis TaxID=1428 RepID=A0A1C4DP41_BACTU|nr:hypothetical protein BK729_06020 [Bacillus thuringiensis serovar wratislaviensis]PEC58792.1 hypothetical protein CON91_25485 [Bacillus wiedmannii]SCC33164.1 Uncharacterized protein BTT61001_02538 [Bacillus thuringiensis]PEI31016.1 hypothetical protein CN644_30745 [Bacillus wiedmannii]PEM01438.1 hypothetical protein CN604_07450 [Bacillus wiedmannii]